MTVDRDELIAYALGILDAAEAKEVERYLEAHPEAAAEVRGCLDALADEVMGLEPEAVPDGATASLLARLRAEGEVLSDQVLERPVATGRADRPRVSLWLGLVVAVALALAVFFGVLSVLRSDAP